MKRKVDKLINKILSSKLKLSLFMIVLVVFLLSIGYSAFSSNLNISNIALDVRIHKDIRVTGVNPISAKEATIDNLCEPVTGDDLNYKYVYYDGEYLLGETTYTTGTKSVGDAYRCQVNETDSYIFNIIGQDASGNYNLLLNHNLGQLDNSSVDAIFASLTSVTDGWTKLDARTDSYSDTYNKSSNPVSYTFDYTGHYARFIEYEELQKFDSYGATTQPTWISSIQNNEPIDPIYWAYNSSGISNNSEDLLALKGLGCGVFACEYISFGVRPVITLKSEPTSTEGTISYSNYGVDFIEAGINLPNEDSKVTFQVKVTNIGNVEMGIFDVTGLPDNLDYEIDDYTLKEKICDSNNACKLGISKEFLITIKYKENGYDSNNKQYNIKADFDFQPFYTISYSRLWDVSEYPTEILGNETLVLDFSADAPGGFKVKSDNVEISDFTYENGVLTVPNVSGSIEVIRNEPYIIEAPNLYNNTLTPVKYTADDGWVIANTSEEWYNYENQEWANAVILKDGVSKTEGTPITVDGDDPDALAMFVWIPRYEYKIDGTYGKNGTAAATPGEIEINFISRKQDYISTEAHRIHPAFQFGDTVLTGLWIGKFETSHTVYSGNYSSNNIGCTTEDCEQADGIRVLPNKISLHHNNVSIYFYVSRAMSRSGNAFGFDSSLTNTHLIKNVEWGAAAYLSQTKYGKYGNSNYTGANKEVYINNSSAYYTGRSGGSPSATQETNGTYLYDVELNGTGASTTGNIYGVYDMSGGLWEYTMGYLSMASDTWGSTSTNNYTKFSEIPHSKYYTDFTSTITSRACNGGICYGMAISETKGWYGDNGGNLQTAGPWVERGADCADTTTAGVFAYGTRNGNASATSSFRVVLTSP